MSNAGRIEDAGVKIGGARKDWKTSALRMDDLRAMTNDEAIEHVRRDNVWPEPDYSALVASGMSPRTAAVVKGIRSRIATSPVYPRGVDPAEVRRAYVRIVEMARDVLTTSSEGLSDGRISQLFEDAAREADLYRWMPVANGQRIAFHRILGKHQATANQLVSEGFPDRVPAWRRGLRTVEAKDGWIVARGGEIVAGPAPSEAEALEAARVAVESARRARVATGTPGPRIPERPHLESLVRVGPVVRDGDVASDDYVNLLGFSGVEFGHWVPQDERRILLNEGWDALHDLADVLGLKARDLSLGGSLSVAFGARGSGRAAAHYETGKRVFNFTRTNGAGSLAHEFAHALDHQAGVHGLDLATVATRGATGFHERPSNHLAYLANLPLGERSEWAATTGALFAKKPTGEELARVLLGRVANVHAEIAKQAEGRALYDEAVASGRRKSRDLRYETQYARWVASQEALAGRFGERAEEARSGVVSDDVRVETDFLSEAVKIGKGTRTYWTRPTEMFARAFECHVFDRLAAMGRRSDYLVHGVEEGLYAGDGWRGDPYPAGAERIAIGERMGALCDVLRERVRELGATPSHRP